MDFKRALEVFDTEEEKEKFKGIAKDKTIKELSEQYAVCNTKMWKILKYHKIGWKQLKKKEKILRKPKDRDITYWAQFVTKGKIRNMYYNMLKKCYDKDFTSYRLYGKRGIKVCKEWLEDCCTFYKWAKDNGYKEKDRLKRINDDKDFSPDNCYFYKGKCRNYNGKEKCYIDCKSFC